MRGRVLWVLVGAVGIVLILGVIGAALWINGFLRSEAFRQLVEVRTSEALRSEVAVEPLRWSGSSVFSSKLVGQGIEGGPVERLEAQQLRATVDWRAIVDGAWRIDRLDVVRLDVAFRTGPGISAGVEPGAVGPVRVEPVAAKPGSGWLPRRFELGLVAVQDANVAVSEMGRVSGSELEIRPEGQGWLFDGRGGRFEVAGSPGFDVESFRVRLQQDVVYLTEAVLRRGEAGRLTASGEIGAAAAPFVVQLEWDNLESADVMGSEWNDRLTGRLAGTAEVRGQSGGAAEVAGTFRMTEGRLEGFPVQKAIADFTRSPQFERMALHEVSAAFSVVAGETNLRDFVAESKGLFKLTGGCRIAPDGAIAGKFRVGISPQTLQWLPGSRERVFTETADGYLWTDLTVGGTVDSPTEDLTARLSRAAIDETIETGIDLLKEAPDSTRDAVQDAIDLLSPLLR